MHVGNISTVRLADRVSMQEINLKFYVYVVSDEYLQIIEVSDP